jgi:transposase-like protein
MPAEIMQFCRKDTNKRAIAKLLGVSPNTLYAWLRRRWPESVDAGEVDDSNTAQPTTS